MSCIVVGYGSIGQRHTRILTQLGCKVAVVSHREVAHPLTYLSLADALAQESPDYIIIANQTNEHYRTLKQLADFDYKGTVLVEKPLFDSVLGIPAHHFKNAYVAYNLRFHPMIQRIFEVVKKEKALYAQIYVGQYLPDWRPERDYRMSYSAQRSKGGGVLLDLSHELDYLLWLFGDWNSLVAIGGKYSSLEIDSDDLFSLMLTMDRCPMVQIHVNYLDRISRREITVITENHTIKADLVQQTLQINDELMHIRVDRDDTYVMQHQAILNGENNFLCSLNEGLSVLKMIESAEQSAKQGIWVKK